MKIQDLKSISLKGLRLQKYFNAYNGIEEQKEQAYNKFVDVWGNTLANHFLSKYDDAESLIWALDAENLELFIINF